MTATDDSRNHNIDPHIDSWPLDKAAINSLLADIRADKNWSLENNCGHEHAMTMKSQMNPMWTRICLTGTTPAANYGPAEVNLTRPFIVKPSGSLHIWRLIIIMRYEI